jgi:hypothetical protein
LKSNRISKRVRVIRNNLLPSKKKKKRKAKKLGMIKRKNGSSSMKH